MFVSPYIIFYLLWSPITIAIILPGNCPRVPPTHKLPANLTFLNDRTSMHVVLLIPLEKPSYLFQESTLVRLPGYTAKMSLGEEDLEMSLAYNKQDVPYQSVHSSSGRMDEAKESINFTSTIYQMDTTQMYKPSDCRPPIVEELRLWVDSDVEFVYLYSCENVYKDRDEGLMILSTNWSFYQYLYINSSYLATITQKIETTSQKYLRGDIVKKIVISKLEYFQKNWYAYEKFNPINCTHTVETSDIQKKMIIGIAGLILFVGVICVLLWNSLKGE